jgi:hypothetical protein
MKVDRNFFKFLLGRAETQNLINADEYAGIVEVKDQLLLKLNAYITRAKGSKQ